MSKLNWRKCHLQDKPVRSIADENEWRGKDAAARWLERKGKRPFTGSRLVNKTLQAVNKPRLTENSSNPEEGEAHAKSAHCHAFENPLIDRRRRHPVQGGERQLPRNSNDEAHSRGAAGETLVREAS